MNTSILRQCSTSAHAGPVLTRSNSVKRKSVTVCSVDEKTEVGTSAPADARPPLADPVATVNWGGTLPSRRRAIVGGLTGLSVVLGGNLGGVTGFLLGAVDGGDLAASTRLDIIIPVLGHKRCTDYMYGFEFTYPQSWLADQTVASRRAVLAERRRGIDGGMGPEIWRQPEKWRGVDVIEPAVAFGPPGSTGEQNMSVIVAPILPGFSLTSMGPPQFVADRLLAESIAPPGSGKEATLLDSGKRMGPTGEDYYTMEYNVKGATWSRRNLTVLTARGKNLYTFNATCPEGDWSSLANGLSSAAASFALFGL